MNDPIISPWLVWFIGTTDGIKVALILSSVAAAFAVWMRAMICDMGDRHFNTRQAILRSWICAAVIVVAILIPGKNTIIGMIVASKATPANIAKGGEWLENQRDAFKQDLIEIIEAVGDDDNGGE